MPDGVELQSAASSAMPLGTVLDEQAAAQWEASLSWRNAEDEAEASELPLPAPAPAPAEPASADPAEAHSARTIEPPAETALAVQRQLTLAATPGGEHTWQLSLPAAWELLAVRHEPTQPSALPSWTLTLCPAHVRPAVTLQESATLTSSLERLQSRLARLATPVHAQVVLATGKANRW